jgi:hypothetical protein
MWPAVMEAVIRRWVVCLPGEGRTRLRRSVLRLPPIGRRPEGRSASTMPKGPSAILLAGNRFGNGPHAKGIQDGNPRALLDRVRDLRIDIVIAGGRNIDGALGPAALPGPLPGARLRLRRHGGARPPARPHPGKPHLARRSPLRPGGYSARDQVPSPRRGRGPA